MSDYAAHAANKQDVALQLPTGSGKTLVGLLIGEWRRRKFHERVVYLCPTKQLVHQVAEQAQDKYGLSIVHFTGRIRDYAPSDKADYKSAGKIAITTYSSIFNSNPYFDDADTIIVDDAHAAENYIASLWSLRVERFNPKHDSLFTAISNLLRPHIDALSFSRLIGDPSVSRDPSWVNKLPSTIFHFLSKHLSEVISEHAESSDLKHPWAMLETNLLACHLYISSNELLLRPLIPPTWAHSAFENAKHRIFMSATLGNGGDLERLTGRRSIFRIAVPDGWDKQGVGRRFFIFPSMSLTEDQEDELCYKLMRRAKKSLVLTSNDQSEAKFAKLVSDKLCCTTFNAQDIEISKKPFVDATEAVAVIANRYDGIDFPGKQCRLLIVEGFPKAGNLQERFLMVGMGASILFNERIQTRVLQAIGRCTRSLEDFSAVVITGSELPDYLTDHRRIKFLHPEIQAELKFGLDQSKSTSLEDFLENFDIFLKNGAEWEDVNEQIVKDRHSRVSEKFPAMEDLMKAVPYEVEYQMAMWRADYLEGYEACTRVLGALSHTDLRGYRALWHYLAGSAAFISSREGEDKYVEFIEKHFHEASKAAPSIPWLVRLKRQGSKSVVPLPVLTDINEQLERVEAQFEKLGVLHDRAFTRLEKQVIDGVQASDSKVFESAHKLLGELLGYISGKVESDGSPDPWWISGEYSFVFEDHAGAQANSTLDVSKARQVMSHPNWLKENVALSANTQILAVLITPVSAANVAAMPHLQNVSLWPLEEFRKWAIDAMAALRALKTEFLEPGNLIWRARAAMIFKERTLDAESLAQHLRASSARERLKVAK
jgi:hypothetical protein